MPRAHAHWTHVLLSLTNTSNLETTWKPVERAVGYYGQKFLPTEAVMSVIAESTASP